MLSSEGRFYMFSPMRNRSQISPAAATQVLQRIRGGIALSLNSQDVLHAPCLTVRGEHLPVH